MHIEKIEDKEENVWFEDKDSKKKFTRIIAGFAWPGVKPGFVVAVAENFDSDLSLKARHLRVLAEVENKSLDILFQRSLELRDRYCVQEFYGNYENKSMMDRLYYYNQDHKDSPDLSLRLASFPEDFGYHNRIIEEYLVKGKRILHFKEESVLPSYLMALSSEEAVKGSVYDYPAIAALGYAVSYLKGHPWKRKKSSRGWRFQRASSWRTV